MQDIFDNPDAFEPFFEKLVWQQKAKPRATATVHGSVLHGRKLIESYSAMSGVIKRYSDTWTVIIPNEYTRVNDFAMGDSLSRVNHGENETFTVQSVTKEDGEWIVSCTASNKLS